MRTLIFILSLVLAAPAFADGASSVRAWIAELQASGYTEIEESRTWLWRIRITAERGDIIREIILDRTTGEVLRDISRAEDGDVRHPFEEDDGDDDDIGDDGEAGAEDNGNGNEDGGDGEGGSGGDGEGGSDGEDGSNGDNDNDDE